jgi:hypothetical protein
LFWQRIKLSLEASMFDEYLAAGDGQQEFVDEVTITGL